ncbi:MAG: alpha/beta hydrolase [Candidatus Latescibacterota bacterium]|nr:MAG: alpha/beta hydrolase [Candidatus Latescibacterota bacterium]
MKRNVLLCSMAVLSFSLIFLGYATETAREVSSSDGVPIRYLVQGGGDPALVFVHCWCCDRNYWKNQVPYFVERHKVVTIDLAGHGDSGLEREDWTLELFAADVSAVIDTLDLDRVILIGHSMGGPVIMEAARLMPGRVIGIIGVDTFQDFEREYSDAQKQQFIVGFTMDFATTTSGFVKMMFPADADTNLVNEIAEDMSSAPPRVGIGAMKNLLNYKPVETLKDIEVPIRCINSDMFPTNVESNAAHTESFDVKYMKRRGHFLMLEDPDTFNELLAETIAELTSG